MLAIFFPLYVLTPHRPYRPYTLHLTLLYAGRMLTIFALYVSYTGDADLMLTHFGKARALAQWLLYRCEASLAFPKDDLIRYTLCLILYTVYLILYTGTRPR